uniref:E3 SUMO-protein ligase NSE2 n=1 Tax=Syphacia muris TaxID=451379 RepID=A0A0N5APK1_9BILA
MELEFKDNVKNWNNQFSRGLTYVESLIDSKGFIDSTITKLIKDFEELEQSMKIQTAALEELLSTSEPQKEDLEDIINKRIRKQSKEKRKNSCDSKIGYLLKKVRDMDKDQQNTSGLVVESVRYSRKDHISKKDIEVPMRNTICKHVYDKATVELYIENCKRSRTLCQCPVPSCKNKKPLNMNDMESYPDFFNYLVD